MKEQLVFLYDYNRWASGLMWRAIAQLNEEQWLRPQAYSRGSVHDQVVHMMYAPARWFHSLAGKPGQADLQPERFPHWQEAQTCWDELWRANEAFVAGCTEEDLQQVMAWGPTSRGYQGYTPYWQILTHLVTHTLDHRAQIFMMMNTEFGVETPEQDIFYYFYEQGLSA